MDANKELLEALKKMLKFSDGRMATGSRTQEEASFADEVFDLIIKHDPSAYSEEN